MPASEVMGKIAVQAVPGAIGALLARTQLGGSTPDQEQKRRETKLGGELFIMSLGALVLSFNIAPTEEIMLSLNYSMVGTPHSWPSSLSLSCMRLFMPPTSTGRPTCLPAHRCGASSYALLCWAMSW